MSHKIVKIEGMHCASCEVLIERKFKKIAGVEGVKVKHTEGKAEITASRDVSLDELNAAVKEDGYNIVPLDAPPVSGESKKKNYMEIGAAVLIVMGLYVLLKNFNFVPNIGVSDTMSYGVAFVLGLVAAVSTCLAVTGGLLLAVTTKYNEMHPELAGFQKFRPHIFFNAGRIVSYALLGGALGALGSFFTLSPFVGGMITIIVSVVMIILGLQMLGILKFTVGMPKMFAHKIYDASVAHQSHHKMLPFAFGAATFFLPCGFTQTLQLYVLSRGDPLTGALTMLAFSLGTLPALISVGAISSYAKGAFQRYFMKTAAVLVIVLGVLSIQSGLVLTGAVASPGDGPIDIAQVSAGKQVISMKVAGLDYFPARFTLQKGIPVEWNIDGSQATGCTQVISVPKLGINQRLSRDKVTMVTFTPQQSGTIAFTCGMGMAGPGYFEVT